MRLIRLLLVFGVLFVGLTAHAGIFTVTTTVDMDGNKSLDVYENGLEKIITIPLKDTDVENIGPIYWFEHYVVAAVGKNVIFIDIFNHKTFSINELQEPVRQFLYSDGLLYVLSGGHRSHGFVQVFCPENYTFYDVYSLYDHVSGLPFRCSGSKITLPSAKEVKKILPKMTPDERCTYYSLSISGDLLIIPTRISKRWFLKFYNKKTGKCIAETPCDSPQHVEVFDNRLYLLSLEAKRFSCFDLSTKKCVHTMELNKGTVNAQFCIVPPTKEIFLTQTVGEVSTNEIVKYACGEVTTFWLDQNFNATKIEKRESYIHYVKFCKDIVFVHQTPRIDKVWRWDRHQFTHYDPTTRQAILEKTTDMSPVENDFYGARYSNSDSLVFQSFPSMYSLNLRKPVYFHLVLPRFERVDTIEISSLEHYNRHDALVFELQGFSYRTLIEHFKRTHTLNNHLFKESNTESETSKKTVYIVSPQMLKKFPHQLSWINSFNDSTIHVADADVLFDRHLMIICDGKLIMGEFNFDNMKKPPEDIEVVEDTNLVQEVMNFSIPLTDYKKCLIDQTSTRNDDQEEAEENG